MKKIVTFLILLALGSALVYLRYNQRDLGDKASVQKLPVSAGPIVQSVRAVGTLQAVRTVRVGSQVSGTVKAIYVDYNTVVKKDQIIAELDPSLLEVQVAVQQANIARQENDLAQQRVQLANEQKNLERSQTQFARGLVSQQQLETVTLQVKSRQSQIAAAEKMKVQAEAQLTQAKLNVSYCVIRSPIDGVVVNRFTDAGQTIQASVNTPNMFMIATDLTTLRLSAGVDEAEIGHIRRGMPVTFTVESYRGQTFRGRVAAVRLNAQNSNSVVTYPVWIEVPNADLKLRPSMTANLQIVVDSAPNAVRVPKDALKFRPTTEMYSWLEAAPDPSQPRVTRLVPDEFVAPARDAEAFKGSEDDDIKDDVKIDDLFADVPKRISSGQVWVYDEHSADPTKKFRQIPVRTGLADAQYVEVVSGDLRPGLEVVTAVTPPVSALQRVAGNIFQQPQRGGGGMQRAGEAPLPVLNQGGGGPRGGARGR